MIFAQGNGEVKQNLFKFPSNYHHILSIELSHLEFTSHLADYFLRQKGGDKRPPRPERARGFGKRTR
jgi:hypothetical protein